MCLLLTLLYCSSECQLQAEFTLSTITKHSNFTSKEVVTGHIYLLEEPMILFEVSSPITQLMWIKRDTVDIYYPEEHKLFRIISRDSLPSQKTTIPHILNLDLEHQLHLAGLRIKKEERKGDTTFLHWQVNPNDSHNAKPSEIITGRVGEDLVVYRVKSKGIKIEFQFREYTTLEGKRYPTHLRSVVRNKREVRIESLHLKRIRVNTSLPSRLAKFEIPKDAVIKTRAITR